MGFIHIHWCVLALYTQYFPELCEKKLQAYLTSIKSFAVPAAKT